MSNARTCPTCGGPLPDDIIGGLCPRCVARVSLASPSDEAPSVPEPPPSEPAGTQVAPPTVVTEPVIPDHQPGDRIGRYKLLQRLEAGGKGSVWMAEQTEPVRRMVALKVIKPGMDSAQVLARFEAERQALALMDHPNIAKILDAGATPQGRPYFVMELIKGIPLTRFCDEQRLSVRERLELFLPVCQAIQHAHQKAIIHRDLKPGNVLVALYDGRPVPKVIDFGVAKALGQPLTERTLYTQLGAVVGTLQYMAPEQAELNQLDIDTRSDIYSLGVLLYELLTGTTPLTREAVHQAAFEEVLRRIREEEPPKPSQRLSTSQERLPTISAQRKLEPEKLTKTVRGELDWIVMKALEKDRSRRYETANGFALDLRHYLNDEPVLAGPPTVGYRVKKFVRKHRKAVAVAAGFVALLATATVVGTGLMVRAQQAKQETQDALSKLQIQKAQESLLLDQGPTALAYLARVLRQDLSNPVAAEMLLATLTYYGGSLPHVEPVRLRSDVVSARFSPEGQRVVTGSSDGTAQVWDMRTGQVLMLVNHDDAVTCVQFSPDGQRVVTGSADNTVRMWDARTGKPLTEPMKHEAGVDSAVFSPDGQRLVTASSDKTARIWDAQTGKAFTEPLRHEDVVYSAQFSPDSQRVVTASRDQTARVWDARTGLALTEPLQHSSYVRDTQFSPDGRRVVTASSDKTARVWDAQTGEALTEPLRHEDVVISAQFSPDGQRVVTASWDMTARMWDAHTGEAVSQPLKHDGVVNSAQFSPDGQRVVTASGDQTARVWDAYTGAPISAPLIHEAEVNSAQFSPDGQHVFAASGGILGRGGIVAPRRQPAYARVWDAGTMQRSSITLGHKGRLNSAQFSPDGRNVVTASSDKTARVWDACTGLAATGSLTHEAEVNSAQFGPHGQWLVTACGNSDYETGYAQVWDASTGQKVSEPMKHGGAVLSAQFSPDGRLVVTRAWDKSARVWDAHTGRPITGPLEHRGRVYSVQFSPDGKSVLTACGEPDQPVGYAQVWDARTGKPATTRLIHDAVVFSAQFSPDGQRVVTQSTNRAYVWNARTGKLLTKHLKHDYRLNSVQFSPNGQWLVTACGDSDHARGYAQVWDVSTGQEVSEPLQHAGAVISAQFSPDGRLVVTRSWDKSARVWNARTGRPVTEPLKHHGPVSSAQFSPNGQRLMTACGDFRRGSTGYAQVWDARTGLPLTGPLKHNRYMRLAQFSPDGQRAVTVSADGMARVWELPSGPLPVPRWLPELVDAIAGRGFSVRDVLEIVPYETVHRLKTQLGRSPSTDYYTRWARWFLADRSTRTISPFSSITIPEYIQRRIQENTLESLQEAVRLSPTNGLAFARLAKQVLAQSEKDNPRRVGEADFFSRYAVKLAPQDAEVAKTRAEIVAQMEGLKKP